MKKKKSAFVFEHLAVYIPALHTPEIILNNLMRCILECFLKLLKE